MANPRQEIIDALEEKALALIMAEGFDRAEAQEIFNDWLERKAKQIQAQRFQTKLAAIR